jgi:acyl-coenzyme A thioesterase PaaI-like protein
LHATARIVAKADFKHVWDVEIKDDQGKLISISRVTNSVKPKNQEAV